MDCKPAISTDKESRIKVLSSLNKRELETDDPMEPITRSQVIGAYLLFLNREPENEEVITQKLNSKDLSSLIKEFIQCGEFKSKNPSYSLNGVHAKENSPFTLEAAKILLDFKQDLIQDSSKEPSLETIVSQLCTASQFKSPIYIDWCSRFGEKPRLHRKQWEFVYILQALEAKGLFSGGKRGLGFGCGKEPLPAVMADRGCEVLATDLDLSSALEKGWAASSQHSAKIEDLYWPGICSKELFFERVKYRNVDMNAIPEDLVDYDFVWSSCAFEHLGSIEHGLQFVINSTKCLRPGGVAIHTTEFNLSSNEETLEEESLVFYRKRDIEELVRRLEALKCVVAPLNLVIGERVEDGFVDLPPYKADNHIKLAMYGHLTTSIGLVITKY